MAFAISCNGLRLTRRIFEGNFIRSTGVLVSNYNKHENKVNKFQRNFSIQNKSLLNVKCLVELSTTIRKYSKKSKPDYDSDSDSDDEVGRRQQHSSQRGNSDFWRRKMRTLHAILDVNKDGVISFDDFMLLARNFEEIANLSPDTAQEFKDVIKELWEEEWGEIDPYNLVTAEQFLIDMHHELNDKDLVKKMHRLLPYFFKAVDTDHSGYLNLDQYKLFFRCLGLSDEDAAVSFAVIDKNGDGKLTLKEFVKLGKEFFLTEDERKVSRMFWGPLIDH